jgi:hypothetical protein
VLPLGAALLFGAALCAGCVSDRVLGLELRPPRAGDGGPAVPAEVVSWEVRLSRLEGDSERCPTVDDAAAGRGDARLGHAQSFPAADGMGMAIGEVPEGRWALAALGRAASCAVVLYGCSELELGGDPPLTAVVDLEPATSAEGCGCRTCDSGACTPVDALCE